MTHGSLFSGIGGFDLAAQWMGWENRFHCEWNEFGKKVLKYYWPEADSHDDITKTDFTKYNGTIDLISGGFPCQPYSSAGKRLGKADDRHLWPHMLRAIKEVAPRWVVGENVRGLTNWNGGLVFDEVCADLENIGYQVAPYLIPACAVNAPHRRERIWFVAYRETDRLTSTENTYERKKHQPNNRNAIRTALDTDGSIGNASDTDNTRNASPECGNYRNGSKKSNEREQPFDESCRYVSNRWQNFPTQPPICGGDDGFPGQLDGITFSKWRNESIKAYGNAVVVPLIYQIFKAIEQYETTQRNTANRNR